MPGVPGRAAGGRRRPPLDASSPGMRPPPSRELRPERRAVRRALPELPRGARGRAVARRRGAAGDPLRARRPGRHHRAPRRVAHHGAHAPARTMPRPKATTTGCRWWRTKTTRRSGAVPATAAQHPAPASARRTEPALRDEHEAWRDLRGRVADEAQRAAVLPHARRESGATTPCRPRADGLRHYAGARRGWRRVREALHQTLGPPPEDPDDWLVRPTREKGWRERKRDREGNRVLPVFP